MDKSLIGGPELLKAMAALPAKMSGNFARGGARAGAARLAKGAKGRIRRKSGKTAKLIKVKSPRLRDDMITSGITTKGDDQFIARLLETGTAAHIIAVRWAETAGKGRKASISIRTLNRNGHEAGSLVIGGKFVGEKISHPGATPHPFMAPTLEQDADAAVQAALEYMQGRFTKEGLDAPDVRLDDEVDVDE